MDALPSPHQSVTPWMPTTEVEPPKFDLWGLLSRRKWLLMLGMISGLGLAYLYFSNAEELFTSEAKIRITPNSTPQVFVRGDAVMPEAMMRRHDKDIASESTIRRCFEENDKQDGGLKNLSMFKGMTDEDRINYILKGNLVVTQDSEDLEIFKLAFTGKNQNEVRVLLNSIVNAYRDMLEAEYAHKSREVAQNIKAMSKKIDESVSQLELEKQAIFQELDAKKLTPVSVAPGGVTLFEQQIGTLFAQIQENRSEDIAIRSKIRSIFERLQLVANAEMAQGAEGAIAITDAALGQLNLVGAPGGRDGSGAAVPSNAAPPAGLNVPGGLSPEMASEVPARGNPVSPPNGLNNVASTLGEHAFAPSAAAAQDPAVAADVQVPNPAQAVAATPPTDHEQMRMAVGILDSEFAKQDDVRAWVREIDRILVNAEPNDRTVSQIVLSLMVADDMPYIRRTRVGGDILLPEQRIEEQKLKTITDLEMRLAELRSERAMLTRVRGENHYQVKMADDLIKALERQLNEIPARFQEIVGLTGEKEEEFTDPQRLSAYVSDLFQQHVKLREEFPTLVQQLNYNFEKAQETNLARRKLDDIEAKNAEFRVIKEQIRQALAAVNSGDLDPNNPAENRNQGYRFQINDPPSNGRLVWPNLPIVMLLGGMLGLLCGFGLGYLVDLADKTFHNPDEIMKHLSVPLIGHVPIIQRSKRHVIENSYIDPLVCSYHRPKAQPSEAFRAIRTALFFSTQGKKHTVIQVTSPTPGDGKSTVAANLAVSIAQSGKRVLLLDADMRRPTIHHAFGIKSGEGFAQALENQIQWQAAVYECEEIPGLAILPCGAKPHNPAEILSSPRVKEIVDEMRQAYDFVIIDTPPVLAVTDPCPVAARVDGVILTLRIKKNVKISSDRAAEILQSVGGKIIGIVVNGVGAQSGYGSQYSYGAYRAGYQYNGYGYGYGYGYGGRGDEDRTTRVQPPRGIEAPVGDSD